MKNSWKDWIHVFLYLDEGIVQTVQIPVLLWDGNKILERTIPVKSYTDEVRIVLTTTTDTT